MIAATSTEAYYGVVQTKKQRQYDLILSAMETDKDYSFSELYVLTGLVPGTCSARISELRDKMQLVERSDQRRCTHTGCTVVPHRIKAEAMA